MTIVVNFDLPMDGHGRADCETYLHRIGRTGRFGKLCLQLLLHEIAESINVDRSVVRLVMQVKSGLF